MLAVMELHRPLQSPGAFLVADDECMLADGSGDFDFPIHAAPIHGRPAVRDHIATLSNYVANTKGSGLTLRAGRPAISRYNETTALDIVPSLGNADRWKIYAVDSWISKLP